MNRTWNPGSCSTPCPREMWGLKDANTSLIAPTLVCQASVATGTCHLQAQVDICVTQPQPWTAVSTQVHC